MSDGNFAALERSMKDNEIGIIGMSRYVSLFLPAEEKVKTIENVQDMKNEIGKVKIGLGFNGYSVANVGETAVTAAAMAIVKLAIEHNLNLSKVKNLWYSTETPSSLAANDGVAIRDAVNRIGMLLKKYGIADIGVLDPEDIRHNQSACVSGVESLFSASAAGNVEDTIIVTADVAYYKFGSKEDETGGYGGTAQYIGRINEKTSALKITKYRGSSQSDNPDFDKRVLKDSNEKTGIAKVAKYPIVFGPYSEIKYMFNTFIAIEKALKTNGIDINNKDFFDKVVLAGHTPYPAMPQKAIGNLLVHFMRTDPKFKEEVMKEIREIVEKNPEMKKKFGDKPIEIPYIDGFETQTETFEFILDVEGLYYKLKEEAEAKKLSGNNVSQDASKIKKKAEAVLDYFGEFREKFSVKEGSEVDKLFKTAETKIEEIKQNGGTLEDLLAAFSEIDTYINAYIASNSAFNSIVRQTNTYKTIAKKMNVEESLKLSRTTGNIYTGSAFQSLMSLVAYSDPKELEGKYILFTGFGSKEGSYVVLLKPQNVESLSNRIRNSVEFEEKHRDEITGEEYKAIRVDGSFDRIKPIISDTGEILQNDLFSIDKDKLKEYFGELVREVNQIKALENNSEIAATLRQEAASVPSQRVKI